MTDEDRRNFLKALGSTGAAGLAGCSSILGGEKEDNDWQPNTTTPEPEGAQETFEYFFQDQIGTLGNVGDQEIPDDAADWQVANNELEEDEWQEMQSNDLDGEEGVTDVIAEGEGPNAEGYDGSVEAVIDNTRERLENSSRDEPDAVAYTRALTNAVGEEISVTSSGGAELLVPSMAEPILSQLDLEIPGYSLSTVMATESLEAHGESDIGHGGLPRNVAPPDAPEDGEWIKVNSGYAHPTGLLMYENEDGEQEVKYSEVTSAAGVFKNWIREPENSFYGMPLESEPEVSANQKVFPEHFVTPLEYTKARRLNQMSDASFQVHEVDKSIAGAMYNLVDDAGNDQGPSIEDVKSYGDTSGWDVIVEDSFGERLEEFHNNPTKEQAQYMENAGRGLKLAFEKQGYDEPLRISGILEDPTFEHLARDEYEQIIDERLAEREQTTTAS